MPVHDRDRIEHVARAINTSFASVSCPIDDLLDSGSQDDDQEVEELRKSSLCDWRSIPEEAIEANDSALGFLSPAAFVYFLPAYMSRVLRFRPGSNVTQAVLGALYPV